ncbi:MAG: hypothetical protein RXQ97_04750 [Caldivirga sp.]
MARAIARKLNTVVTHLSPAIPITTLQGALPSMMLPSIETVSIRLSPWLRTMDSTLTSKSW